MATIKASSPKKSSKEVLVNEITLQLTTHLANLKDKLGEKKFEKRIRKAAKLLTGGIKMETPVTRPAAKKTSVAKPTKKSTPATPVKKATKAAGRKR